MNGQTDTLRHNGHSFGQLTLALKLCVQHNAVPQSPGWKIT